MERMSEVRIRALEQNAAAVVAEAAAGETVTILDRGRPVAQITAIPTSRVESLIDAGQARVGRRRITDLRAPSAGPSLSRKLESMRAAERF
jgi:antitoxin (DNA-binding transcriptional repressor) of toxin-antitoxin stability system